jgi:hypothetical protein
MTEKHLSSPQQQVTFGDSAAFNFYLESSEIFSRPILTSASAHPLAVFFSPLVGFARVSMLL